MSVAGAQLLKLLGSGVRPVDAESLRARHAPIESLGFADLLRRADSAELRSGLTVRETDATRAVFDKTQLERLSQAADAAEAAGASRLVAVIDGVAATIDIAGREVVAAEALHDATQDLARRLVRTGVDAFVIVPTEGGVVGAPEARPDAHPAAHGSAPGLRTGNPQVAELLAGMQDGATGRLQR